MRSTTLFVALALLLGAGAAQAQFIGSEECGTTREEVAGDIVCLADNTVCGGAFSSPGGHPICRFKGQPNCVIQDKLVRKLDADPVRTGKPRHGAATKVLQGKDESALKDLQNYINGIDKSKVVPGREDAAAELRATAEVLRDFCVPGVAGLPPVE